MSKVTKGGGNVFKDLGLPQSGELLVKAELTRQIHAIIKDRLLTQAAAADLLGVKQPDVSALMRGRFTGFSSDRLMQLLTALDRDVEIVIKPKPKSRRHARVRVSAG